MDILGFETLTYDVLKQESDLLEEVVNPYRQTLSEIARKRITSNAARVPHVIMLADHPDAQKVVTASTLQDSGTGDVIEWVQKEVWNKVERNYGSFHGPPEQLFHDQTTSLVKRQALIWINLRLSAVDTFILLSHALIYFDSLTCCIACATNTGVAGEHHKANDNMPINPEKINMVWIACIHLAVLTLTHWETRKVPSVTLEHHMMGAFGTKSSNFQYVSPEKHGAINTLIRLVLRSLGYETNIGVEDWIKRFKNVLAKPGVDTESIEQVSGSGTLTSSSVSTAPSSTA